MTGAEAIAFVKKHTLLELVKLVTLKFANDVIEHGFTVERATPTHRIVVRITKTKLRAKKPNTSTPA